MMMQAVDRRHELKRIIETPDNLYQFGQSHQDSTNVGNRSSTGCTHVCIQLLTRVWHQQNITINDVSEAVGYTTAQKNNDEGMTGAQIDKAFQHFNLPYKQVLNPNPILLRNTIDNVGPVMMAVGYDFYPEWQGYVYQGHIADGKPNGYSIPLGQSGRNQLVNAGFGHAIVSFGHRDRSDLQKNLHRYWLHDPNHKSDARPESDPLDAISEGQLYAMLRRFTHFGNATVPVTWFPTKVWTR